MMNATISRTHLLASGAITVCLLSACGSVSDLTKERLARTETSVQQAQQSIGNSEVGAMDLQRARDTLAQAQAALKDKNEQQAVRLAQQAQLDAELAVAKSQSAAARKAADEVQASTQTLREEASRTTTPPDR